MPPCRHLYHFGYHPVVVYLKPTQNVLYKQLHQQLSNLDIPMVNSTQGAWEPQLQEHLNVSDVILDAIFGKF
jgi:NAD(P)H-hydrate epimerase